DVSLQPHLIEYFRLYSRLDCNIAIQRLAVNGKTRHLYRSLDVHPVIDNIRNKLRMCKWLIGAAHDSEADVVASSTFSAAGDSGSLIVSRRAAHPTALLFAGSSTTPVGNPIGQVLSHVSSSLGKQVSFVGSSTRTTNVSCPAAAGVTSATQRGPSRVDIDRVAAVKQAHESDLMADPAVMAVGIGADERNSAVITVYVETGRMHGAVPAELEGVPIRIISTDRIRAYGWNERQSQAAANSCSARQLH